MVFCKNLVDHCNLKICQNVERKIDGTKQNMSKNQFFLAEKVTSESSNCLLASRQF